MKKRNNLNRKMRRLRFYAAVVTGALAEVVTAVGLWAFTEVEIFGIAFWALAAYAVGMASVLCATEPRKRQEPKRRQAVFYTLPPEGYEYLPMDGAPEYMELVPIKKQA